VWDRKYHGHKHQVAQTPEGAEPSPANTPQTALGNLEWSLKERGNGGLFRFDVTCPSGAGGNLSQITSAGREGTGPYFQRYPSFISIYELVYIFARRLAFLKE